MLDNSRIDISDVNINSGLISLEIIKDGKVENVGCIRGFISRNFLSDIELKDLLKSLNNCANKKLQTDSEWKRFTETDFYIYERSSLLRKISRNLDFINKREL